MITVRDILIQFSNCNTGKDEKSQYWELSFDKGNIFVKERSTIARDILEFADFLKKANNEGSEFCYDNISSTCDIVCTKEGLEKLKRMLPVYQAHNSKGEEIILIGVIKEKKIGENEYLIEDVSLSYIITNIESLGIDNIPCDSIQGLYIQGISEAQDKEVL